MNFCQEGVSFLILLQGKSLTKSYGAEMVFDNISFVIKEGEKVGLVGPNGAGKTTIFRCLTGKEDLDAGEIMIGSRYSIGYLEQIPEYPPGTILLDVVLDMFADIFAMRDKLRKLERQMGKADGNDLEKIMEQYSKLTNEYEQLGGFSVEAKTRRILKGIGFSDNDFNREVNKFSGGEKTRASLAKLLVREPDLLLLDEPTNHLDLKALEWLENYLKNYQGAVLVISHDRYFLDQVITRILEIKDQQLKSFPGNYSRFLVLKKEQEIAHIRAYEKQQEEIKKKEEYILKYKAGIKSKQARGRQKHLARLERLDAVKNEGTISLDIKEIGGTGDIVLEVEKLGMSYADKKLFSGLNFTIYKGEKVALIGGNGTGKSTILKIIVNKLTPLQGSIRLGSRVKTAYFDQEHKELDNNNRVIDEIMFNFNIDENEARKKLAQVMFQDDDVFKSVGDLSGGEKGRLSLLKIILKKPNLLIMDEPTNHLDIASKEVVENFLNDFTGTVLLVSHDRYLLDEVTDRTLELEEGTITNYLGNYTYYKTKKTEMERIEKEREKAQLRSQKYKPEKPRINKSKLKEEIKILEEKIEKMEGKIEFLSSELANSETYQDEQKSKEMVTEFKKTELELPKLYEEWEELTVLLENC